MQKSAFSHETCFSCHQVDNRKIHHKFVSANVATSEIYKGMGSTWASLVYPNESATAFEAGEFAYMSARNIDYNTFLAEQAQAFAYFIERFGLDAGYILSPVLAPIPGTLDYYEVLMLGTPLWRVEVPVEGGVELVGYYRPAVYRKLNDVICFRQHRNEKSYSQAIYAEHELFLYGTPLLERSRLCCEPGQNFSLPSNVSPQFVYDLPNPNGNLAMSVYGFLTLTGEKCAQTEIVYRSLYQNSQTLSSNFDFSQIPVTGDMDGALYYGLLCEASSAELSNGAFNGILTLSRTRRIMGNVNITADIPNYTFVVEFNAPGFTELINNGVLYFPKSETSCILGGNGVQNYVFQ